MPVKVSKARAKRYEALLGLALLALVITSCGSSDHQADPSRSLLPATKIEQSRADEDASLVAAGRTGMVASGVRAAVRRTAIGGDELGPWLVATVHVENTGSNDLQIPTVGIVCSNSQSGRPGSYQAASTLLVGDDLPGGSFRDGTFNLLLPGDSRTGAPVPLCANPAYIQFEPLSNDGATPPSLRVPIDPAQITALNAARQSS